MTASSYEDVMREINALYEKSTKSVAKMQEGLNSITGKARSKSRMISVAVDSHGKVTELKFHTQAWRKMAPGELSKVILDTIEDARQAAQRELWPLLSEFLPAGIDPSDMRAGGVNWAEKLGRPPALPDIVTEMLKNPTMLTEGKSDPFAPDPSRPAPPTGDQVRGQSAKGGR